MKYTIALIGQSPASDGYMPLIKAVLDKIAQKRGVSFELAPHAIGDIFTPAEPALHSINDRFTPAEPVQHSINGRFTPAELAAKMDGVKSAHAILLGSINDGYADFLHTTLIKKLGLHTKICHFIDLDTQTAESVDFYMVSDALGGIYSGSKGFRTRQPFGREAFDEDCYSELEIERTARIAYELADIDGASDPEKNSGEPSSRRALSLVDKASKLNTSKLWRKIVTDIIEDYPSVHLDTLETDDCIAKMLSENVCLSQDVLLCARQFADNLSSVAVHALHLVPTALPVAYVGDTPLGVYGRMSYLANDLTGLMLSVALMLRHSFDMGSEADNLLQAISKAKACSTSEQFICEILKNLN